MTPLSSADASYSLCCQGLSVKVNASLHMPTASKNCCMTHHKRSTFTHALSSTSCVLHRLLAFSPRPQVLLFLRRLIVETESTGIR
jgi:hypothetical protein